ncbi:MAG: ABC transporter ATP-binding protein [Bacilli bacterium]|nr:ABC transporter ATP-binding protein [Bacilli bacterium]
MKNVIEIKDLVKKYEKFELGRINLEIPSGCIIGLIGENGAGKTTLIKSILNIIKKEQGSIKLFGQEIGDSNLIQEEIGVVLDNSFFPELLTAKDINSTMKSIYSKWDEKLFQKYIQDFNLPFDKAIKTLSKGMRKKLEIATALSHHPKLLILDEPTSGLDPVVRSEVLDIFLNFIKDEEHTILLSTHITSDLEHIADQIVFIDKGKILLHKDRDELLEEYGILKCSLNEFSMIMPEDIMQYKKNKYGYEILIGDRNKLSKKYANFVIDKITLEELMVLMIKGEKSC